MRINSPDAIREKKKPYSNYHVYAVVAGIVIFFVILYVTKGMVWFVKLVFSHWLYIGVGVIILLFLKRFFGRKHMVVHQAEPQYPGY